MLCYRKPKLADLYSLDQQRQRELATANTVCYLLIGRQK